MARDFSNVQRIVIKVGTALLTNEKGLNDDKLEDIVSQIANLKQKGYQILLVSSGAIGMGAKELGLKTKANNMAMRQACASIGQPLLMSKYYTSFRKKGIICSQILVNRKDFNNRTTFLNLRNSVEKLINLSIIPIFNENDATSTAEIGTTFGDNDRLSALIASKIDAGLMIILSDIDGLYTSDPKQDKNAKLLEEVNVIDKTITSYAGSNTTTFSTGGMKTKIMAAQIALRGGTTCVIANGKTENVIERILKNESLGTCFHPTVKLSQRERWIMNNTHSGSITVDEGAYKALLKNNSLLAKGVIKVEGTFDKNEVVKVLKEDSSLFAKALVGFSSNELVQIMGHNSNEANKILNHDVKKVVFRPEDMVFIKG